MNKTISQKILETIEDHEKRIVALEKESENNLTASSKGQKNIKGKINKYTGPTGGIKLLVNMGFFKEKKDLSTIRDELKKNGYLYSRQSVNTALNRQSKFNGPLVRTKEGKRKEYAERK